MDKFKFICRYCDYTWNIDYMPTSKPICWKCSDTNIRIIDLERDKIDYYAGSPPFVESEHPTDEPIKLSDWIF